MLVTNIGTFNLAKTRFGELYAFEVEKSWHDGNTGTGLWGLPRGFPVVRPQVNSHNQP